MVPLQWRHNERGGVSNHQRLDCSLNRLIKENIKAPRYWPLYVWNSPVTSEFSAHWGPVTRKMLPFDDVIMFVMHIQIHSNCTWKWDAMTSKRFRRYWHFLMGMHRSSVESLLTWPMVRIFTVFLVVYLNKLLNKKSCYRRFCTSWSSYDVTDITHGSLFRYPQVLALLHKCIYWLIWSIPGQYPGCSCHKRGNAWKTYRCRKL